MPHIFTHMTQEQDDPIWNAAWQWVQREYDRESFDAAARSEMTAWLVADPLHRKAYDKAARLWLLAGLVPPESPPAFPPASSE